MGFRGEGGVLYPRHQGGEEGCLFVGGGGDLVFYCVTQGHKLIDFNDNDDHQEASFTEQEQHGIQGNTQTLRD
jgi:hypothetical protein